MRCSHQGVLKTLTILLRSLLKKTESPRKSVYEEAPASAKAAPTSGLTSFAFFSKS
ncbi:MAG: hypothetical protein RMX65_024380 [Nostoc sp. DedQUE01]